MLDWRREKERVKRDPRKKGHISEIFPEFSELRPGTESGSLGLALRVMHYIFTHTMPTYLLTTVFVAISPALPRCRSHKSKNKIEGET